MKRDMDRVKILLAEHTSQPHHQTDTWTEDGNCKQGAECGMKVSDATKQGDTNHPRGRKRGAQDELRTREDGKPAGIDVKTVIPTPELLKEDKQRELKHAFLMAVSMGHTQMVEMLLKAGATANETTHNWYPLGVIAANMNCLDLMHLLIAHNVNVKLSTPTGSAIHAAARVGNLEMVKLLHSIGADLEEKTETHHQTPLHIAAQHSRENVVTHLLEQGCTVDSKDINDQTPLHLAARSGHVAICDLLIKAGASMDAKDNDDKTPIMHAIECDHPDMIREDCVSMQLDTGQTLLHYACKAGAIHCVRKLLNLGADCNITSEEGITPVMEAVKNLHNNVVECLLSEGPCKCDLEIKSLDEESAISLALNDSHHFHKETQLLDLLLKHGASINTQHGSDGDTLLRQYFHDDDRRNWLIAHGADISGGNGLGNVFSLLADRCSYSNYKRDKKLLDDLINLNVDLRITAEQHAGRGTPLQHTLSRGCIRLARDMLAYGFSVAHMSSWLLEQESGDGDSYSEEYLQLLVDIRQQCEQPLSLQEYCRLTILPCLGHFLPGQTTRMTVSKPYFKFFTLEKSPLARAVITLPVPRRLQLYLLPSEFAKSNVKWHAPKPTEDSDDDSSS